MEPRGSFMITAWGAWGDSVAGLAAVVAAVHGFLHGVARLALALGHDGAPSASQISGGPAPVPRGGEPAL